MFGMWQPRPLDSSPTERSPQASISSTQRRLGSDSARAIAALRGRSSSLRGRVAPVTASSLSLFAQMRKHDRLDLCVGGHGMAGLAANIGPVIGQATASSDAPVLSLAG